MQLTSAVLLACWASALGVLQLAVYRADGFEVGRSEAELPEAPPSDFLRATHAAALEKEVIQWYSALGKPAAKHFWRGPLNVSGTYRGQWRVDANLPAVRGGLLLQKDAGVVVYQLRTSPSQDGYRHIVQGEVVMRDGLYITDEDLRLRIEGGSFDPHTGRLNALLKPYTPLHVPLSREEREAVKPESRQRLRTAISEWAALRMSPGDMRAGSLPPYELFKECSFVMMLAALELSNTSVQPGHWAQASTQMRRTGVGAGRPSGRPGDRHVDGTKLGVAEADVVDEDSPVEEADPVGGQSGGQYRGLAQHLVRRSMRQGGAITGQPQDGRQDGTEGVEQPRHSVAEAQEQDVMMVGYIISSNCDVAWHVNTTTIHLEQYYAKAVHYSLSTTAITFLQVVLLFRQMDATSTPASAARVSLLCVSQQAIMDAYLCLLHLTAALVVEPLFNAFATAAFFEFVIFAIFEMRYILLIWRAQRPHLTDTWSTRRELSLLYTRFYGVLLLGIFAAYQLQGGMWLLVFALYSFWLPQVVHNILHDVRQPLHPHYVICTSATRLALPLYIYGCPHNLLRTATSPHMCAALVLFVAAQVSMLMLQHYLGPRWFIPRRFLPLKYDYHRPVVLRRPTWPDRLCDLEGGPRGALSACAAAAALAPAALPPIECVICMSAVDVAAVSSRMVTPCGHFFHPHCLQRWMDVKMECPTCRRTLPPA